MEIITDAQLGDGLSILDRAWEKPGTFALIPERGGVTEQWVTERLSLLPSDYGRHHFILLTSGSTGVPKFIVGSRRRAESLTEQLHLVQDSEPVRRAVQVLPLTYCYALVNQWLWSRVFGRTTVPTRGFRSPAHLGEILEEAEDAMLCLVGAQLPLFRKYFPGRSFRGTIRLHFAGGPFPQNDLDYVRRLFPNASVFNNYGCAEAMPRLTVRRAEESASGANVGKPLAGIRITTSDGGRILFKSPFRMVAQIDSEGFRRIEDDAWVPSGDIGYEGEDGFWYLKGRANEVYKRFGEKISLGQIASSLKDVWPGEAAFYREKDRSGEEGHVLVLAPCPTDAEVRGVLMMFRRVYARAFWPLRVESTGEMPRLSSQKVDARALASLENKTIHWDQRV